MSSLAAVKPDQSLGRPKIGMFMAVPDSCKEQFNDISPNNERVQAVKFNDILILNVYFPTDPGTVNFDDNDLLETIGVIKKVIEENPAQQIFIGGDLNADFNRISGHVNQVRAVIDEMELIKSWSRFDCDFTHVSSRDGVTFIHTLDHFLWSENTDTL